VILSGENKAGLVQRAWANAAQAYQDKHISIFLPSLWGPGDVRQNSLTFPNQSQLWRNHEIHHFFYWNIAAFRVRKHAEGAD
jgi:hypothetical protein